MEQVDCNNCGSAGQETLYEFDLGLSEPAKLVRCTDCGLIYLSPRPGPGEIGDFYPKNYQENMLELIARAKKSPAMRLGFDMIRRRRTPKLISSGRLLDVGCSNGAYLAALRERGWEVEGVEMDEHAASYAANERGLKVTRGDAESALRTLDSDRFSVVTMWHLLEHLFDPLEALKQVRRVLKPGGVLMLEVPDISAPPAAWFKKNWFPLDIPRHLYHFSPETLREMLAKAGLKLVEVKGIPSPEAIVWSMAARKQGRPIDFNRGDSLKMNPLMMAAAFPVSWTMAQFVKSDHIGAAAVRES